MNLFRKVKSAMKVFKEDGFGGISLILVSRYRLPIPQSAKFKWNMELKSEILFWDDYFQTKKSQWEDAFGFALDPELALQSRPAGLLPPQAEVHILDVGAGPLTHLGKKCEGKKLDITAVDPLADEYNAILSKYNIKPLIKTEKLAAETLTARFPSNKFDLVFARNCIDHSYDPEKAILQMIAVVKRGRYVLLEHWPHEARHQNYSGLHQWNFFVSDQGDFIIGSKSAQVNITKKHAKICTVTCEMVDGGCLLVTRIKKKIEDGSGNRHITHLTEEFE